VMKSVVHHSSRKCFPHRQCKSRSGRSHLCVSILLCTIVMKYSIAVVVEYNVQINVSKTNNMNNVLY
jgi:hypothetical protein